MLIIAFNLIWLLNIICVFLKKRNRIIELITVLFLIRVYFVNTNSSDYDRYLWMFEGGIRSGVESGFLSILNIGIKFGLSFLQIQGICATLSLLIVLVIYRKFSNNFHYFFAFYMIYQYFADLNLLRNFMMRALLLVAVYYLIKQKKSCFIVIILIATLIHRTAIVYLPLVFLNLEKGASRKFIKYFPRTISIACIIVFFLGNNWKWVYNFASVFLGNETQKLDYYFTTKTHLGFLIYFGLFLVNFFVTLGMQRNSLILENDSMGDSQGLSKWIMYINYYSFISFPLIMINNNFYRLYNNMYFINLIYYAAVLDGYEKMTRGYCKNIVQVLIVNYLYRLPVVQSWNQKFNILEMKK